MTEKLQTPFMPGGIRWTIEDRAEQKWRHIDCWDTNPDREQLVYSDLGQCVLDWIAESPHRTIRSLPLELEVTGFSRQVPSEEAYIDSVIEDLWIRLDEEYGDPDEAQDGETSVAVKRAARQFVRATIGEFRVWNCDPCCVARVALRDFIRVNKLDRWLQGGPR